MVWVRAYQAELEKPLEAARGKVCLLSSPLVLNPLSSAFLWLNPAGKDTWEMNPRRGKGCRIRWTRGKVRNQSEIYSGKQTAEYSLWLYVMQIFLLNSSTLENIRFLPLRKMSSLASNSLEPFPTNPLHFLDSFIIFFSILELPLIPYVLYVYLCILI